MSILTAYMLLKYLVLKLYLYVFIWLRVDSTSQKVKLVKAGSRCSRWKRMIFVVARPPGFNSLLPTIDTLYCSQQLLFPPIFPCGSINLWSDGESLNDVDDGKSAMEVAKHDFPGEEVRMGHREWFCSWTRGTFTQWVILARWCSGATSSHSLAGKAAP